MFLYPDRITKARLESDAPTWKWTAKHNGMGWQYIGVKSGDTVTVKAFAMMCGPAEDDYSTQWRVDDGEKTVDYASWIMTVGRHAK